MVRGIFRVPGRGPGSNFATPRERSQETKISGIIPRKSLKPALSVLAPDHLFLWDMHFLELTAPRPSPVAVGWGRVPECRLGQGFGASLGTFCKVSCSSLMLPFKFHWVTNSGPLPKASAPFLAPLLGNVRQHSAEKKHRGQSRGAGSRSQLLASSATIGKSLFLVLAFPPVKWVDWTWQAFGFFLRVCTHDSRTQHQRR